MRKKSLEKMDTIEKLRYGFDWAKFVQTELPDLAKQLPEFDDGFMLDSRVTDSLRSCMLMFYKNDVKVARVFFASGYGRDFMADLREQLSGNILVGRGNDGIPYAESARASDFTGKIVLGN